MSIFGAYLYDQPKKGMRLHHYTNQLIYFTVSTITNHFFLYIAHFSFINFFSFKKKKTSTYY